MKLSIKEREWRLIQRLARRAEKGLKVPDEFMEFAAGLGLFIVEMDNANKEAIKITTMSHSEEYGIADIQAYLISHPPNVFAHILSRDLERRYQQREVAKNPRTKKATTNKSITTVEMRKWRENGYTFDEFLAAALIGSIIGMDLEAIPGSKYRLSWEGTAEEVIVTVVVPTETGITKPFASTVATLGSFDKNVTDLSVVFSGVNV